MPEQLPDPERSYAVLIGTSSYQSGELAGRPLPAVRNNLTDLAAVLTDPEFGGSRPDHCTVLLDHADGYTALRALSDNANCATDTLLVYFAGHGLPGPRSKELYLTLANTDPEDAVWWRGALAYNEIRRVLLDPRCRAANRVVILDCCFSGRAIPETAGADTTGAFGIHGTYTLTAVGDNQLAYAPPGDTHTAFTGELLKVLRDGVPQGPELLTLNTVYLELDAALTSRDLHRPRQNNNDTVAGLALTRNPAYGHNEDRKGPRPHQVPQAARTGPSLTATPVTAIPTEKVYSLAFSSDGGSLAVATGTNTVRVFDTTSWRQRLAMRQNWLGNASVFTVAFSPLGDELAAGASVADGGVVQLWYTSDGRRGRKITHGAGVWAVAFSPDGGWLATGDHDGNVQIWNARTGRPLMRFAHLGPVHGAAFSPDRRRLATGSSDQTSRVWDVYTGEQKISQWGGSDHSPRSITLDQVGDVAGVIGVSLASNSESRCRGDGSGSAGGAELVLQGPGSCRAVGGWQCGEVGFQLAQHQLANAGSARWAADASQPVQRAPPDPDRRPQRAPGTTTLRGTPRCGVSPRGRWRCGPVPPPRHPARRGNHVR